MTDTDQQRRRRALAIFLDGLPGWSLILGGLVIVLASLLADQLGIGSQVGVIGWKQLAGASVGGGLILGGTWYAAKVLRQPRQPSVVERPSTRTPSNDKPIYDSAEPRIPFIYELSELYRYRFLLINLISRDLKVRYKRSVLGFVWAMVNPLLTMIVLVVVFVQLFRFQIENYPIYILSGLLIWNQYSSGTSVAMNSVLSNAEIRKKIYVPASVFVAAAVGSALVNLLFALIPLLALTLAFGISPRPAWLLIPVPVLMTTILTFGVGVIVAALAVFYADVIDIYEVLLRALFYLKPNNYTIAILPAFLLTAETFNPLYQFISLFRTLLLGEPMVEPVGLAIAIIESIAITFGGWSAFTRLSDEFAYRA